MWFAFGSPILDLQAWRQHSQVEAKVPFSQRPMPQSPKPSTDPTCKYPGALKAYGPQVTSIVSGFFWEVRASKTKIPHCRTHAVRLLLNSTRTEGRLGNAHVDFGLEAEASERRLKLYLFCHDAMLWDEGNVDERLDQHPPRNAIME